MPLVYKVRASSLPEWKDCQRRWAANNIGSLALSLLQERSLPNWSEGPKFIGSFIGDCAHFGSAQMCFLKKEGRKNYLDQGIDEALHLFDSKLGEQEIVWDDFTKTAGAAKKQIANMLDEVAIKYMPDAQPAFIEHKLKMKFSEKIELTGHPDVITHDGFVDDFKFGARDWSYTAQGGAYLWLASSCTDVELQDFRIVHVKRTGLKKEQKACEIFPPGFRACVDAATTALEKIEAALDVWYDNKIGDLEFGRSKVWAFDTNSNSKLCTKKTCLAWGTTFCDQWKEKGEAA